MKLKIYLSTGCNLLRVWDLTFEKAFIILLTFTYIVRITMYNIPIIFVSLGYDNKLNILSKKYRNIYERYVPIRVIISLGIRHILYAAGNERNKLERIRRKRCTEAITQNNYIICGINIHVRT